MATDAIYIASVASFTSATPRKKLPLVSDIIKVTTAAVFVHELSGMRWQALVHVRERRSRTRLRESYCQKIDRFYTGSRILHRDIARLRD